MLGKEVVFRGGGDQGNYTSLDLTCYNAPFLGDILTCVEAPFPNLNGHLTQALGSSVISWNYAFSIIYSRANNNK